LNKLKRKKNRHTFFDSGVVVVKDILFNGDESITWEQYTTDEGKPFWLDSEMGEMSWTDPLVQ